MDLRASRAGARPPFAGQDHPVCPVARCCRCKRWTYASHRRATVVACTLDEPTCLYWRVSGHRLKLTHSRRTSGLWRGRFEMYGAFRYQGAGFEGSWLDVRTMVEGWRRGTGRAARRIAARTGRGGRGWWSRACWSWLEVSRLLVLRAGGRAPDGRGRALSYPPCQEEANGECGTGNDRRARRAPTDFPSL
jgi:hypothetical protein